MTKKNIDITTMEGKSRHLDYRRGGHWKNEDS